MDFSKKLLFLVSFIGGTVNAQNVQTATNGLYHDPISGTTPRTIGLGGTLQQNTAIDLGSSYDLYFKKGGSNYFGIANNGDVVIPKNLEIGSIYDPLGQNKLKVTNGDILVNAYAGLNTAMGALKFSYFSVPGAWAGLSGISNSGGLDQLDLAFYTAYGSASEKMRIMALTGFVGIGTNNPQTCLEINGSAWGADHVSLQSSGRMRLKSPSSPGLFLNDATTDKAFIGYAASFPGHAIGFYTPVYGWAMNMLQNGNIGIGTTAPAHKLDVNGDIYTNGKVLIGASNVAQYANYALAVNGDAIFNKVKVKLYGSWADYVFDDNYQLPALSFVETFIKKHKHLPGIPAAAQVEKEGIDIASMQSSLLQKIEELTLYSIEQEKKSNQQQTQIDNLKQQLETIKKLLNNKK